MGKVIVAFSSHRIEALEFMQKEMEKHEAIVLEEPANPKFNAMLEGKLDIDKYIDEVYPPFPEFSRRLYRLLIKFNKKGKKILQIEPYLETLEKIYKKIDKEKPDAEELSNDPELGIVYRKESEVFQSLLKFYESSRNFDDAVKATVEFAKKDASRIKLRDKMRASEIKKLNFSSIYVEAGYIHFPLANYLRAKRLFLLEKPTKKLMKMRHALSPSDILTLRMMHIDKPGEKEKLLAARSLIYVSLITKKEMVPTAISKFPHLEEEARVIKFVNSLDYDECKKYFNMLTFSKREYVWRMLEKKGLI